MICYDIAYDMFFYVIRYAYDMFFMSYGMRMTCFMSYGLRVTCVMLCHTVYV